MRKPLDEFTLKRTVAPTVTPVTVADAKTHLRIDDSDSDSYISELIEVAAEAVTEMAGKALITQTWQIKTGQVVGRAKLYLPFAPVQSITSIAYFDADDASQSADTADYALKGDDDRAWIEPVGMGQWPSMYDRTDALTVTYVAGYGASPSNVPANLRQAVKMLVGHWYENREAANHTAAMVHEIPFGVREMVNLNRVGWVAG